ncbi:hypothetical protein ETD86_24665 [Nonomuraea turkmeniaca]|uniref:Uncharacterized protein n=1 Tax=Nonomuraea turkmeniaca TaxID=103838 RepID=A0A5S4FE31_9ACTN|nr:hypothetical protein [Nonomuraea turkmeniaca]TMR16670.1 hypothetical protein ETD86_24665 [Nonomuraea turkmeniaca]
MAEASSTDAPTTGSFLSRSGSPPTLETTSDATFVGDTVRVEHNFLEETAEYRLGDVQRAAEEYWTVLLRKPDDPDFHRHLRPDLSEHLAYLYFWEETWQEPHPYRGRLGIPAQGSE